ncbi:unnamed protein product [Phyllotreta striolata]|uniref:C-type lectin domain-containing protein n=1 Tax=Phyllotreta striolata TaxID=444603 RepID=A0A9N9THY1_PHYSR|nr:unnamed protein product [Phyllotreta striolata]
MKELVLFALLFAVGISYSEERSQEFTSVVLSNNNKNPNWFKFGEKTYYVDTVFTANWYKALQFCRQQGMQLLSIATKTENDRIGKFLIDNGISYGHYWTSATNLAGDHRWIWLSTGQPMVYTNWDSGEPNSAHNSTENCVEVRHWSSGFTWNDLGCSQNLYFICETVNDCVQTLNAQKN